MKTKRRLPKGVYLAFCPTGEGGGVDNSCPPANAGTGDLLSPGLKRELGLPEGPVLPASTLPAQQQAQINSTELSRLEATCAGTRAICNELRRQLRNDPQNAELRARFNAAVREDRVYRTRMNNLRDAIAATQPASEPGTAEAVQAETRQIERADRSVRRTRRTLSRLQERINDAAAEIEAIENIDQGDSVARPLSNDPNVITYWNAGSYGRREDIPTEALNKWYVRKSSHMRTAITARYPFRTPSGRTFVVSINLWSGDGELIFTDDRESVSATGRGEAFHVFSSVIPAVTAFIDKYKPTKLTFSAAQDSRYDLYNKCTDVVRGLRPGLYKKKRRSSDRGDGGYITLTRNTDG